VLRNEFAAKGYANVTVLPRLGALASDLLIDDIKQLVSSPAIPSSRHPPPQNPKIRKPSRPLQFILPNGQNLISWNLTAVNLTGRRKGTRLFDYRGRWWCRSAIPGRVFGKSHIEWASKGNPFRIFFAVCLKNGFQLDAVVTVINCCGFLKGYQGQKDTPLKKLSNSQISFANVLVLSKLDLVSDNEVAYLPPPPLYTLSHFFHTRSLPLALATIGREYQKDHSSTSQ